MRAGNVSVCIPYKGCDKNCEYCVSKMTGMQMESDPSLMKANVKKVKKLADVAQVFSILLTGKGEPMCNLPMVEYFIVVFKEYSVELQTNGIILRKDLSLLGHLSSLGLNIVAVSVDDFADFDPDFLNAIHTYGMLSRVTFNLTNKMYIDGKPPSFRDLMDLCKTAHVDQMTIRNVVAPDNTPETKESIWIKENVPVWIYSNLVSQMKDICLDPEKAQLIMKLPYGVEVYDYEGIAISYSDYCIQNNHNGEDIRSLIYQEDGHIYTSWNSGASKFGV